MAEGHRLPPQPKMRTRKELPQLLNRRTLLGDSAPNEREENVLQYIIHCIYENARRRDVKPTAAAMAPFARPRKASGVCSLSTAGITGFTGSPSTSHQ
jgi:hypothetical protein